LKTDDINLVRHVSNLRPTAFIIVLSNKTGFKEETALNFGVYVLNSEKGDNHIDVADSIKKMFDIKEKIVVLNAELSG
jgi:pyruvate kinase